MRLQQSNNGSAPKLAGGPPQLSLRAHHDRSMPGDGLAETFARDEQKSNSLAGLNCHPIATVEENEQAVAVALANREIASRDGLIN